MYTSPRRFSSHHPAPQSQTFQGGSFMATVTKINQGPADPSDAMLHRWPVGAGRQRQNIRHRSIRRPKKSSPKWPKAMRPMSIWPSSRPQRVRKRPLVADGRPRSRPADEQAGRPDRGRDSTSWPRSKRSTTASRFATRGHADLPLTIDCLRYYAGWADKIHGQTIPIRGNYFCYTQARTGGRGGPDHSLELSAADGRLEMGPGAGGRLHDRDEAGRANAAHLPAAWRGWRKRPAFPTA